MHSPSPITAMPGKVSNKLLNMQGWNAAVAGYVLTDCPYYATSISERHWKAGFRSVTVAQVYREAAALDFHRKAHADYGRYLARRALLAAA